MKCLIQAWYAALLTILSFDVLAASFDSLPSSPNASGSYSITWRKHYTDFGAYELYETVNGVKTRVYRGTGTSKSFSGKAPGSYAYELKGQTEVWIGPEPILQTVVMDNFNLVVEQPNQAPTISSIAAQSVSEDGTKLVQFTIGDPDNSISDLTVTTWHSSSSLLNSSVFEDTSGASRVERKINVITFTKLFIIGFGRVMTFLPGFRHIFFRADRIFVIRFPNLDHHFFQTASYV